MLDIPCVCKTYPQSPKLISSPTQPSFAVAVIHHDSKYLSAVISASAISFLLIAALATTTVIMIFCRGKLRKKHHGLKKRHIYSERVIYNYSKGTPFRYTTYVAEQISNRKKTVANNVAHVLHMHNKNDYTSDIIMKPYTVVSLRDIVT